MHRFHPRLKFSLLQADAQRLGRVVLAALVLVVALAGISFWQFNRQMYQAVYEQNMENVGQLSGYFIQAFRTKLESCFQTLENTETLIIPRENLLEDQVFDQLQALTRSTGFSVLGVIDMSGNLRATNGRLTNVDGTPVFDQVISGNRYISDVFPGDDTDTKDKLLLAVPLYLDGEIAGALYGRYLMDDIISAVEFNSESNCYFQIIDSNGQYITRSNSGNVWSDGVSDIWTEIDRYDFQGTTTADEIRSNITAGKSGSFYCTFQGDGRYGSYQPIGINQWYVFSMLPEQDVVQHVGTMRQIALQMLAEVALCLIVIGLVLALYMRRIYYVIRDKNTSLEIHNRLFQLILQKTNDIPFEVDLRRLELTLHSPRFPHGSRTLPLSAVRPSALAASYSLSEQCYSTYRQAYEDLLHAKTGAECIVRVRFLGKMTWFKIRLLDVYRLSDDTRIVGVLEYYEEQMQKDLEIERRKQQAIHLSQRSQHDFLTGLFNRETFEEWVNAYLREPSPQMQAFLMLDLDHFKEINDTMGHTKGDDVLRDVAKTLRHQFRKDDIIARLGGDEFVILLKNLDSDAVIERLAASLNRALCRTYTQDNISLSISASIGIARAPIDGTTFAELYPKADAALYEVKRSGKGSFHIYQPPSQ